MRTLCYTILLLFISISSLQSKEPDPPEVLLGERLFLESRFSQFFSQNISDQNDINSELIKGDPALNKTVRFFGLPPYQIPFIDGPYKGKSFNCRSCHLVDEHLEQSELGMRSYTDFASRSPLPTRDDGMTVTTRNSPTLVDTSLSRKNFLLHFDGEFPSLRHLIRSTLTGRNMGWLPNENSLAKKHICKVVQDDNGQDALAINYGGLSYSEAFSGTKKSKKTVESSFLLPDTLKLQVHKADCEEVFNTVANLISIYIEDLNFSKQEKSVSPYDLFLKINHLPMQADKNETNIEYSKRLMQEIHALHQEKKLTFVHENPHTDDGGFHYHDQPYEFTNRQLDGMKIFFAQNGDNKETANKTGNCVACHPAPHFTDFGLHNIGITQIEYEAIHGQNSFNTLKIPNLAQREKLADHFLPATTQHPNRESTYRSIASESDPMKTDLGAWNVFYNTDYPLTQESIYNLVCIKEKEDTCTSHDDALRKSIARFKTPSLRNLGHSAPYMHNGQISDLHAVVSFYFAASNNARHGQFRNPDEDIIKINISPADINPLALFLISLYEDFNN